MSNANPESYDPSRPHVFVCYSHADRKQVFAEFEFLREAGINLRDALTALEILRIID